MRCESVLDLIDAEGLVDIPAATLNAARTHALECGECAEAFAAAGRLTRRLRELDRPKAVLDFSHDVMQQILAAQASAPAPPLVRRKASERSNVVGWRLPVGAMVAAGMVWAAARDTGWTPMMTAVRLLPSAWLPTHTVGMVLMWLALGLGLSVLALRAPVKRSD